MPHFISLQYLRAIAALMVVLFHMFTSGLFDQSWASTWLRGGVDIFFVISGCIMMKSTQAGEYSPSSFYLRRVIRIVPLYWIATIAALMAAGWTGWHSIASFLFLPAVSPTDGLLQPVLHPGWTLNYEMFFYLLYGLLLTVTVTRRIYAITALFSLLVVGDHLLDFGTVAGFYSNDIIFEFIFGMLIAQSSRKLSLWLFPAGFMMMVIGYQLTDIRILSLGVPAMLIVWSFISAEANMPQIKLLRLAGDASYAIYLFHLSILGAFARLWSSFLPMSFWFIFPAFATVVGVGIAIHLWIEKPLTTSLNSALRRFHRRQPAQVPPILRQH